MSNELLEDEKGTELTGERSAIFDPARGRLSLLSTAFLILYILLGARLLDLTVVQGTLLQIRGGPVTSARAEVLKPRGDIYDRNGVLLATTLKSQSLYADPALIEDPAQVAKRLARLFPDLNMVETIKRLSSDHRFVWIARHLSPSQQEAVLMIGEPGLRFRSEQRRVYPQGPLGAHLVGYTDVDGKGLAGIERAQNTLLGSEGRDLHLTLDTRLQFILRDEIRRVAEEFNAKAASALIMDVQTGALLAGMSWPDFDPNHAGKAPSAGRFNRLSLGVYELGSVFKIFSTAALLEEGSHFAREFDAREPLQYGRFKVRDYHAEERILNVPEVFIHSSNIGAALMGEALGTKTLKSYYRDLGLTGATDFSLQEVGAPIVPEPWREINTLTASYGHGIAVSPLQLASAVATTIGDGMKVHPHFLMDVQETPTDLRVFSPKTVKQVRQLMRLAVTDGTGKKGNVSGYQVGGKTGTAEKPGLNGYHPDKKLSSFVSVFPMQEPRYLVLVVVDEPKGNERTFGYATGGWVAAPATARIVRKMTHVLGMKPTSLADKDFIEPLRAYLESPEDITHAEF